MKAPPPIPSPQVPRDHIDDTETDPRSITGVYAAVGQAEKHWSNILKLIGVIGAAILTVAGVAKAQTDAGVKNTNIRLEQLEQAHKNHLEDEHQAHLATEKRFDRFEDQSDVINKKLTLLLDEAQVAKWKRPPEVPPAKDGGP